MPPLPHDDPAHRAGPAGAAARGAGEERQDADLLHQRAGAQLAARSTNLKVNSISAPMAIPPSGVARFPGQSRRRTPSARSVRADAAASRPCAGRAEPGARCARQFRIGQGKLYAMTFADFEERIRDDLDRMLGPGGFSSGARHRRDHRQPLAARLQLRGQFAVTIPTTTRIRCSRLPGEQFGPVAIANTDAGGDAWVHYAIDRPTGRSKDLGSDDRPAQSKKGPAFGRAFRICA